MLFGKVIKGVPHVLYFNRDEYHDPNDNWHPCVTISHACTYWPDEWINHVERYPLHLTPLTNNELYSH